MNPMRTAVVITLLASAPLTALAQDDAATAQPADRAPVAARAPVAEAPSAPAAQDPRVEFDRLTRERDRLTLELRQLDRRAADLVRRGGDASVLHAEQISTQDRLDLVRLRLELMAARHGFALRPAPSDRQEISGDDPGLALATEDAFARGRERALAQIREDNLRFLASIDFSGFLAPDRPRFRAD